MAQAARKAKPQELLNEFETLENKEVADIEDFHEKKLKLLVVQLELFSRFLKKNLLAFGLLLSRYRRKKTPGLKEKIKEQGEVIIAQLDRIKNTLKAAQRKIRALLRSEFEMEKLIRAVFKARGVKREIEQRVVRLSQALKADLTHINEYVENLKTQFGHGGVLFRLYVLVVQQSEDPDKRLLTPKNVNSIFKMLRSVLLYNIRHIQKERKGEEERDILYRRIIIEKLLTSASERAISEEVTAAK